MFPTLFLTAFLLFVTASANPVVVNTSPVRLPTSRRVNLTSVHNLYRHDYNRAQFLKAHGQADAELKRAVISTTEDNQAVTYVANVGIGNPSYDCEWII